ncbi:hypothetical protein ATANTOWER_025462 [Ataeniobius toweri]|uniref:Uncharacterized protein n=1 Tax=Ataeniobius toweri TaxID=208326 RepID=A0ABU7BRV3_9TELE|nr:hypothetical protein [Ataeniobius toweri]
MVIQMLHPNVLSYTHYVPVEVGLGAIPAHTGQDMERTRVQQLIAGHALPCSTLKLDHSKHEHPNKSFACHISAHLYLRVFLTKLYIYCCFPRNVKETHTVCTKSQVMIHDKS